MTGDLQVWVGRAETRFDDIDARPARLMRSILPFDSDFEQGDPLPPLWHWLYFHQPVPLGELGRDGHPQKGGFLPPVNLPRRMWAGGRLEFPGELRIADRIKKVSRILSIVSKQGASGPLCFVTVEHRFVRGEDLVLREEHDIVYREDPKPGLTAPKAVAPPRGASEHEIITPSPVMLFRYSALTFNGHRIHYDRAYCQSVEGYPALVFHGPLTATLLADFSNRKVAGRLTKFTFRATAPLFDTEPIPIYLRRSASEAEVWACRPEGGLGMSATAHFDGRANC